MAFREEKLAEGVTCFLGDCREILPTLGLFDACVTDPPYGIGMDGGNVGYKGFNDFEKLGWDKAPPSAETLDAVLGSAAKQIIWGGNYFKLEPSRCFLIWDKGAGFKGRTYAECELAWASFDANARIFSYDPLAKGDYKGKFHPTQKPVELMKWCLSFVPDAVTVIDPFMGSGSTGVACVGTGRAFTGIEAESKYFDIACKRVADALARPDMFVQTEKRAAEIQEALTYDAADDFAKSLDVGYAAIRERKANGGKGWEPTKPTEDRVTAQEESKTAPVRLNQ